MLVKVVNRKQIMVNNNRKHCSPTVKEMQINTFFFCLLGYQIKNLKIWQCWSKWGEKSISFSTVVVKYNIYHILSNIWCLNVISHLSGWGLQMWDDNHVEAGGTDSEKNSPEATKERDVYWIRSKGAVGRRAEERLSARRAVGRDCF